MTLKNSTWVVFGARGFISETEASAFGERLRLAVEIASFCSRLGVDAGQDRPTAFVDEEFAKAMGLVQPHERVRPNIHGLMLLPDDDLTRIPLINAEAKVTSSPDHLLGAIRELSGFPSSLSEQTSQGLQLLNAALMTNQPLAQLVLAFSAVEAMGQKEDWTAGQRKLLDDLATEVAANTAGTDDQESLEVAEALRRSLHRLGLRQGVVRLLGQLGLSTLKKEWDRLYALRSGVVHGTKRLDEPELNQLAMDTITLCAKVIIRTLQNDGVPVPAIANVHYQHITEDSAETIA